MILTEHPEIDFVTAQLNYVDWTNPAVRSKEVYEVCCKHGKPVVIMEGLKGGTLVNIPEKAKKLMKDYNPDASIASWAFRFLLSLPNVRVVSIGMPKLEFLEDNIKTFNNFSPSTTKSMRSSTRSSTSSTRIPPSPAPTAATAYPSAPRRSISPTTLRCTTT